MNHDRVGHMVGSLPLYVGRIYLALDLDTTNFDDMQSFKPDLVITHHPFVYGTKKDVRKNDPKRWAFIEKVAATGACVYSFHTNFDGGRGGMNDALAAKLGLIDIKPLDGDAMARGGRLPYPMAVHEFATMAKQQLGADFGLLVSFGKPTVNSAAIIGGGGSRSFGFALAEGYDIYISGDAPHHVRRAIMTEGYNYLDLPHEIEGIFEFQMEKILLEIDAGLTIKKAPAQAQARII